MPGSEAINALAPWPGLQLVVGGLVAMVSVVLMLRGQKDGKVTSPLQVDGLQSSFQGPLASILSLLAQINSTLAQIADTLRRTEDNQRNVRTELDTQTRELREQTSEHLSAMQGLLRKIEELIHKVDAVLTINTSILSRVDEMLRRK
jgi:transcriptional regulator with GAF, ATPase, and Fis domain